jgi:hypothetical protein
MIEYTTSDTRGREERGQHQAAASETAGSWALGVLEPVVSLLVGVDDACLVLWFGPTAKSVVSECLLCDLDCGDEVP